MASSRYQIFHQYLPMIRVQSSIFVGLENLFPFLLEAMYNYIKTQDSPNGITKRAIHSILLLDIDLIRICGHNFERTVSFDNMVLLFDGENLVNYVDFDMVSFHTMKLQQKLNKSTENGKTSPGPVKNPRASQVTINITVLLTKNTHLITFSTRTSYGTGIQQLLRHSTTLLIEVYSSSIEQ